MLLKNRISMLEELIKIDSKYKDTNFTIHVAAEPGKSVITKTINGVTSEASCDEWAQYCKRELRSERVNYKVILPEILGGEVIEL